ncbi:MAG: peptide-methionine (S)-S-oxide reductase MsrA [Legionellales bacterium]|nr:peptide-methionine (S)-S-oxide reductase MsrA [Legionellales bacterium]
MQTEQAIFAAGCFWGVEAVFRQVPGVLDTCVGYTGGHTVAPTYHQVCQGDTGHAEAVQLLFDPNQLSYSQLLNVFWQCHDPTTLNRQGADVGSQYRSVIFYCDQQQRHLAQLSKQHWMDQHLQACVIVTEIVAAQPFYRAEAFHQRYLERRR